MKSNEANQNTQGANSAQNQQKMIAGQQALQSDPKERLIKQITKKVTLISVFTDALSYMRGEAMNRAHELQVDGLKTRTTWGMPKDERELQILLWHLAETADRLETHVHREREAYSADGGDNENCVSQGDMNNQAQDVRAQTKGMLAQISAARPIAPPIGEHWEDLGGIYAGIARGRDGESDYHLVLLPGEETDIKWEAAGEWAKAHCGAARGGSLPTRSEQALLYANLKSEFEPEAYWSSEPHERDSSFAWCQYFGYGGQYGDHKSAALRAVAVRRLPI